MSLWPQKSYHFQRPLYGRIRMDRRTKLLIPRLETGNVALIHHEDLDEMAAQGLITKKVTAVINSACSMTGRYPNKGPLLLMQADIPLIDLNGEEIWDCVQEFDPITIVRDKLFLGNQEAIQGECWTKSRIVERLDHAKENRFSELLRFLENTLEHADREKEFFLGPLPLPTLRTPIKGRHTLVVVRGSSYREDLLAVKDYVQDRKPVLIGVDGGADALLEAGLTPDLIVGDMDSVSDRALCCGAEIVVHAYKDGRAPGWQRIEKLGLHHQAKRVPAPGTSEDIAMILAHELGAELIVAVGTHSNMVDFLDKGRLGMGSTLLTRLRIGSKLVDAKGVSQLYQSRLSWQAFIVLVTATWIPIAVLAAVNPAVRNLLRMMYWKVKLWLM